jgi:methionyl-tRNA synthetase
MITFAAHTPHEGCRSVMSKSFYLTTPIYYVNGKPHVGSALTTVCTDFLARYHKLRGRRVWFLTGTDEQATKVVEAAEKAGMPTQAFVDGLAAEFRAAWDNLHIGYDDFIRTTEPRHVRVVQEVFRRLQASGDIYKDLYEGWYCVADETYFRDSDVGEDRLCPNAECRQPLRRVQQENWFFRLSAYGDRLLEHARNHPEFWQPEFRRNEVEGFIARGLRDMSVTRAGGGWGIPVADDPDQIIYVWFDAVINYLTATGWPDDTLRFEDLWPADIHLMGKEIFVRFHATLWPAMLMALGLPLPRTVYAHGWWVDAEGRKSGKRTGGLPHPVEFANEIAAGTGADLGVAVDGLRYLLLREMVFHGDSEFSREGFLHRYNTDLANDLGNLCNRSVNMLHKYCGGVVPNPVRAETEIAELAAKCVEEYETAVGEFRFNAALEAAWALVGQLNRYIEARTPWAQFKRGEADELAVTLYTCLEAVRLTAYLAGPAMPVASGLLWQQLGLAYHPGSIPWEQAARWGALEAGTVVADPKPIFPRYAAPAPVSAPAEETTPVTDVPAEKPADEAAPQPSFITIDDFMKIELRTANILAAERLPNSDKLLKLSVEVGSEQRTVLAGIAEMYEPGELVGRQVVIVANLAPRKMRGVESQGMLLAADVDGQAILLQPETKVPSGIRVR